MIIKQWVEVGLRKNANGSYSIIYTGDKNYSMPCRVKVLCCGIVRGIILVEVPEKFNGTSISYWEDSSKNRVWELKPGYYRNIVKLKCNNCH